MPHFASVEREKRYIREYCEATFRPGTYELNVPIGPIPEQSIEIYGLRRAKTRYRPWRRRIDAVAWQTGVYILIEAKIRDPLEGLGRLHTYLTLAKQTPDLPGYEGQVFEKRLIVPFALDWIKEAARADEVRLEEFWVDWIADYVRDRQLYFTRDYRVKREEIMRLRRLLGVE